jgi:hypothetical protein
VFGKLMRNISRMFVNLTTIIASFVGSEVYTDFQ